MSRALDSRLLAALDRIVRAVVGEPAKIPGLRFFGRYRYRIVLAHAGPVYDLQAVDATLGLPDLPDVAAWPSLAGSTHTPALGAIVIVSFLDGDPSGYVIDGYEPTTGATWRPTATRVDVAAGGTFLVGDPAGTVKAVALDGDAVDGIWLQVIAGTLTAVAPATPGAVHVTGTVTGTAKKLRAEKT